MDILKSLDYNFDRQTDRQTEAKAVYFWYANVEKEGTYYLRGTA